MTGDVNSLVVKMGEAIGEGTLSAVLDIRGLDILRGDDGPGGTLAGDWCRLEADKLGSTRLLRFRSRDLWLAIRLKLRSAPGESERL